MRAGSRGARASPCESPGIARSLIRRRRARCRRPHRERARGEEKRVAEERHDAKRRDEYQRAIDRALILISSFRVVTFLGDALFFAAGTLAMRTAAARAPASD